MGAGTWGPTLSGARGMAADRGDRPPVRETGYAASDSKPVIARRAVSRQLATKKVPQKRVIQLCKPQRAPLPPLI